MDPFWEKVEHTNSRLVPIALLALLGIIIVELLLPTENLVTKLVLKILDYGVIAIFVVDLIFLALKARSTRFFFRHYWLDILAVFPFGLLFNFVNTIYRSVVAVEGVVVSQAIFHETLEAERGIKEVARGERLAKMVRMGSRSLRVITKSHLFIRFERKHRKARRKLFGKT